MYIECLHIMVYANLFLIEYSRTNICLFICQCIIICSFSCSICLPLLAVLDFMIILRSLITPWSHEFQFQRPYLSVSISLPLTAWSHEFQFQRPYVSVPVSLPLKECVAMLESKHPDSCHCNTQAITLYSTTPVYSRWSKCPFNTPPVNEGGHLH